jgi:hypothetical protein
MLRFPFSVESRQEEWESGKDIGVPGLLSRPCWINIRYIRTFAIKEKIHPCMKNPPHLSSFTNTSPHADIHISVRIMAARNTKTPTDIVSPALSLLTLTTRFSHPRPTSKVVMLPNKLQTDVPIVREAHFFSLIDLPTGMLSEFALKFIGSQCSSALILRLGYRRQQETDKGPLSLPLLSYPLPLRARPCLYSGTARRIPRNL